MRTTTGDGHHTLEPAATAFHLAQLVKTVDRRSAVHSSSTISLALACNKVKPFPCGGCMNHAGTRG